MVHIYGIHMRRESFLARKTIVTQTGQLLGEARLKVAFPKISVSCTWHGTGQPWCKNVLLLFLGKFRHEKHRQKEMKRGAFPIVDKGKFTCCFGHNNASFAFYFSQNYGSNRILSVVHATLKPFASVIRKVFGFLFEQTMSYFMFPFLLTDKVVLKTLMFSSSI